MKLYTHLPNSPEEADKWLEDFKTQANEAANRLGKINRYIEGAEIRHQNRIAELVDEEQTLVNSVSQLKKQEQKLLKSVGEKTTELATLDNEASDRMVAMQKREADVTSREHAVSVRERHVQISSQRLAK